MRGCHGKGNRSNKKSNNKVVNSSIQSIKKALLNNESTFMMDNTYDEYKKDPNKFKSIFKRRLSETEHKKRRIQIMDRVKQVRRELRMRCEYGNQAMSKIDELRRECLICLEGVADAVVMSCGHGGICFQCGITLSENRASQKCHLCRKVITYYINKSFW